MTAHSKHTETTVRLTDNYVEIERSRMGTKRISLQSIAAVQLKPPGILTAGFIQFTIQGGRESNTFYGGTFEAAGDENSVLFGNKELAAFTALRDAINEAMSKPVQNREVTAGLSIATELAKLAALRDAGVLTESEFQVQKARLLA